MLSRRVLCLKVDFYANLDFLGQDYHKKLYFTHFLRSAREWVFSKYGMESRHADVINRAKSFGSRFKGFTSVGDQNSPFSLTRGVADTKP